MNYIVLDLEWNQSNDSEDVNSELLFEIIEIGAIKLNEKREKIGEFSEKITPEVYKEFHHITERLIHMKMEDLENCRAFPEVAESFFDFCGDDYIFCTWGPLDLYELQRNMNFYNMKALSNGPIKFLDIQKLFSIAYEDTKSRRSLEYAVDYLEIAKDVAFHRALADAYYTAKIVQGIQDEKILENYSFDLFHIPKKRKDEIREYFSNYYKFISRGFKSKSELLSDREVTSMICYKCKRRTRRKIKWFSPNNGKHYYAISKCEKHGLMKGKIRVRKDINDNIYAVKTMKFISEDEMNLIQEKLERAKLLKEKKRLGSH